MTDLDKLLQMASTDNISDELLAAYIDGNTSAEENEMIHTTMPLEDLDDIQEIAQDSLSFEEQLHLYDGDYGYWELGIPPVFNPQKMEEFISEANDMMSDNFNSGIYTYGEVAENVSDPVFILQPDDHSCALRCQQIILRDFGIDIPFKDLEKLALENNVYTEDGTYRYDIGKVLELAGVGMHQVSGTTIDALVEELSKGHRIIVSVDADELWYNNTLTGKLKNWFNDVIGNQGGNHALIVAGIEIDVENTSDVRVVLTDPGTGHLRIEYPVHQFINAWKDSNCFMAATDNPAPYQYDYNTGMEVPSNFSVQQYINQFVMDNSYQLAPDFISNPLNYQPAINGFLDITELSKNKYNLPKETIILDDGIQEQSASQEIYDNIQNLCEDEMNPNNFSITNEHEEYNSPDSLHDSHDYISEHDLTDDFDDIL